MRVICNHKDSNQMNLKATDLGYKSRCLLHEINPLASIFFLQWIAYAADAMSRIAKVTSLGIPMLKKHTVNDRIRFVDSEYGMETRKEKKNVTSRKSMDSSAISIYDNVSPWKNINKALLDDDESEDSDSDRPWTTYISKRTNPNTVVDQKEGTSSTIDMDKSAVYPKMSKNYSRQALKIDKLCRYGFPLTFLVWNIWYWWYYLVFQKNNQSL
uniref:Neur_chan_memb domain-containing protein n=1 Tax=Heterorhabditis bacteriophora TaxID=37862 RepID=A0A1I7X453_HETBA